jgi:hypothetical protein
MASLRKRGKVWYYRYVDADGTSCERKGCPDKRATEELGRAAEADAARRRAGLIDPRAEAYRDHEAETLASHLDDFQAALLARGSTAKHVRLFAERARRVVALVRGRSWTRSTPRADRRPSNEPPQPSPCGRRSIRAGCPS